VTCFLDFHVLFLGTQPFVNRARETLCILVSLERRPETGTKPKIKNQKSKYGERQD
jgi:hypothetical protein